MEIYNSLTKKIEEFKTGDSGPKTIIMYTCGLTPYDSAHIGHARTYVAFDIIKRYLVKKGHKIYHIQNITDVDDKIIKRCKETGSDPKKLTETIHTEALELFDKLNIMRADVYPKVTDNIPEIIDAIKKLIQNGFAYETASGVYYSVSKFKNYGKLSGQKLDEVKSGARVEVDETKKAAEDFAVWKKTNNEIIEFDSPWGRGRPGWHIECSAMAEKYAKGTLDIHGGGRDLIFPHHENEIAQSEAAFDHKFAKIWVHTGPLTVNGEKMSKSLGNFVTLKEATNKFDANAIRMFFTQTHYRSSMDYNEDTLTAAQESVERILNSIGLLEESLSKKDKKHDKTDEKFVQESNKLIEQFYNSMDSDFDTPNAIAASFGLVKLVNSHVSKDMVDIKQLKKVNEKMNSMVEIFGFVEKKSDVSFKIDELKKLAKDIELNYGISIDNESSAEILISEITNARESLRKAKNYSASDDIRNKLAFMGILLEDSSGGIRKKIK
ncbi:MAG: cysteine--tRNA ligase [Candidatus Micrarchaeota archaeon]|nr:cysteine--tRNA ligase [Candidatus Micrarchaeota archaeon]